MLLSLEMNHLLTTLLLAPLAALDLDFLVRRAEPGPVDLPGARVVAMRGPFEREAERRFLKSEAIEVILAKASGGESARAKLDAARNLGLPVVLLRRPPPQAGPTLASLADAVAWLATQAGTS